MSISFRAQAYLAFSAGLKRLFSTDDPHTLVARLRKATSIKAFAAVPKGTQVKRCKINGVNCEWIIPAKCIQSKRVLLYFHGGGYIAGSLDSHRDLVYRLAANLEAKAVSVDYRLAPEYAFPAPYDDAFNVYTGLLSQGVRGDEIIIAGDSAGAHLSMMLTRKVLDSKLPKPAAMMLFSPFGDCSNSLPSREKHADLEGVMPLSALKLCVEMILPAAVDPLDPMFSPIRLSFNGFPPCFINAGQQEILSDDAIEIYRAMQRDGVEAELKLYPMMPHAFIVSGKLFPEGKQAQTEACSWIRSKLDTLINKVKAEETRTKKAA
ncbi:MAG: alpha/beta hydrolase [Pseudomonadales bacterium]|nr:alpha/beta hydrolase [Pseudomonadales bacterium]